VRQGGYEVFEASLHQERAEAAAPGRRDARAAGFLPLELEAPLAILAAIGLPGHARAARAARQRTVLGSVGGKLVQHQAERHDGRRRHLEGLAGDLDRLIAPERRHDAARELAKVGRFVARQQVVGVGECQDAAFEGLQEFRSGCAALRRLCGDRQHRGEQVLQPMLHLANDQLLALRRPMTVEREARQPGANRFDLLGPRVGRAVPVGDEEAAERPTVGRADRPRADGAHTVVGVELAPQWIEALVVLDVAAADRCGAKDRRGAGSGVRRPDLDAGNAGREARRRRHHAMLEGHAAAIEHGDARHAARRERLGRAADLRQDVVQRRVARDHLEHDHLPLEQPGRLHLIRQ
jgi:hypothetical protein